MNNFLGNIFQTGGAEHTAENSFDVSGFISRAIPNLASFAEEIQDGIFQSDMTAAMRASMQPEASRPPVAASHSSIRQLPTVTVAREDLIDPCNRECCICLEGIHLGNAVLRLPCAHVYHPPCIQLWLTKHGNTCPVCRYELPVDNNPEYETGRRYRMRCRKPRFAQHELDRLSIAQLKQLLPVSRRTVRFAERRDLVEFLIQSRAIDVVVTPEPVSYRLSALQEMSISRLKTSMSDAGVFFDAKEVVEKSDMIHIFVASGRLQLLDEPEEDYKPAARPIDDLTVETVNVAEEHATTIDERHDTSILMEENTDFTQNCSIATETQRTESTGPPLSTQSLPNNARLPEGITDPSSAGSESSDRVTNRKRRRYERDYINSSDYKDSSTEASGNHVPLNDATGSATVPDETPSDENVITNLGVALASPEQRIFEQDLSDCDGTRDEDDGEVGADDTDASVETRQPDSQSDSELNAHSIVQLRALAQAHSVDLSGCLERTEIICRLASRLNLNDSQPISANESDRQVFPHPLDDWGISEIRALAALSEVDLSNCRSREAMVSMLNATAITRPQVANYFQTLAPLAQLSVSQLRAVARERQINVSGCLEKGEIIQRLVQSIRSHSPPLR